MNPLGLIVSLVMLLAVAGASDEVAPGVLHIDDAVIHTTARHAGRRLSVHEVAPTLFLEQKTSVEATRRAQDAAWLEGVRDELFHTGPTPTTTITYEVRSVLFVDRPLDTVRATTQQGTPFSTPTPTWAVATLISAGLVAVALGGIVGGKLLATRARSRKVLA